MNRNRQLRTKLERKSFWKAKRLAQSLKIREKEKEKVSLGKGNTDIVNFKKERERINIPRCIRTKKQLKDEQNVVGDKSRGVRQSKCLSSYHGSWYIELKA